MISREQQFAMMEEVLPVLRTHEGPLVLSLHPKSSRADYAGFAKRFDAPILTDPLMDVLVAADVLVAGAYSSTVRWGLGLGMPTANIDFWSLNESTYADHPTYPTVRTVEELAAWFAQALAQASRAPEDIRIPHGNSLEVRMDGHFSERLKALIDELTTSVETRS
jgi:hypothetical protein